MPDVFNGFTNVSGVHQCVVEVCVRAIDAAQLNRVLLISMMPIVDPLSNVGIGLPTKWDYQKKSRLHTSPRTLMPKPRGSLQRVFQQAINRRTTRFFSHYVGRYITVER